MKCKNFLTDDEFEAISLIIAKALVRQGKFKEDELEPVYTNSYANFTVVGEGDLESLLADEIGRIVDDIEEDNEKLLSKQEGFTGFPDDYEPESMG